MINRNLICLFNSYTKGLSGSDRILIELLKRWNNCFNAITILTSEKAKILFENYAEIDKYQFIILSSEHQDNTNLAALYFQRTIKAFFFILKHKPKNNTMIYSSSDFWPDSIPAIVAKLINPRVIWIAGFYLFAPLPWKRDSPYRSNMLRWLIGLTYWLTQYPIYIVVKNLADFIFVTSDPDVNRFLTEQRGKTRIIVVQGGVDTLPSEEYLKSRKIIPIEERKYDACYVGRFHYQKGLLELIDIWRLVCAKKPNAKLAMIGIGPLESDIKAKINNYGLDKNIDLLGFMDGEKKYEIFKHSKIIVHPSIYDSGGMAAAEGMAWGLPGVSFDLESLNTYYPKGMVKTECFNIPQFADNVLMLLNNKECYFKFSNDAHDLVIEVWNWNKRADRIYNQILDGLRECCEN